MSLNRSVCFYDKFKSSFDPGCSGVEVTLLVGYAEGGTEQGNLYIGHIGRDM